MRLLKAEGGAAEWQNSRHRPAYQAVGETVILLHPPLPLSGVSIRIKRGRHQDDGLADGYGNRRFAPALPTRQPVPVPETAATAAAA